MLQQCNHPNVVRYLGSYQGEDYLWVSIWGHSLVILLDRAALTVLVSVCFRFENTVSLVTNFCLLADSDGVLWRWKRC